MNPFATFILIALIVLTACSPANISPPTVSTPETHTPEGTIATVSPPDFAPNIILYRGNAQRTGLFDEPAIRELPEIQWRSKISSIWLMPPVVTDDILYTGGGDG